MEPSVDRICVTSLLQRVVIHILTALRSELVSHHKGIRHTDGLRKEWHLTLALEVDIMPQLQNGNYH